MEKGMSIVKVVIREAIIPVKRRASREKRPASLEDKNAPKSMPRMGIKLYVPNKSGAIPIKVMPIKGAFEAKV